MPGNPGEPVVTMLVCFFIFAREAAGALGARHSPRPLSFQRAAWLRKTRARCGENAEVCVRAQLIHLAPLAGRGRRRREAKSPGEGDYPRFRACRDSPSPARKMLATSPRKRGEVKTVAASNSLDISDAFPGPSSALGSEG